MLYQSGIDIRTDGRGYRLFTQQRFAQPLETIFDFFADATKLEVITPPLLKFRVISPGPIEIRKGTTIDYRLRLHGIPITWRSLISDWEPGSMFVDEQLKGPYRVWRHEHRFTRDGNETLVEDEVYYEVPLSWSGLHLPVHFFLVRPDLLKIFRFRQKKLAEIFAS